MTRGSDDFERDSSSPSPLFLTFSIQIHTHTHTHIHTHTHTYTYTHTHTHTLSSQSFICLRPTGTIFPFFLLFFPSLSLSPLLFLPRSPCVYYVQGALICRQYTTGNPWERDKTDEVVKVEGKERLHMATHTTHTRTHAHELFVLVFPYPQPSAPPQTHTQPHYLAPLLSIVPTTLTRPFDSLHLVPSTLTHQSLSFAYPRAPLPYSTLTSSLLPPQTLPDKKRF